MSIEQLSDFEPKGAACAAFGVLHEGGFPAAGAGRSIGPDGSCAGAIRRPRPGELPGVELLREGVVAAPRLTTARTSAKLRPFGNERKETDRRPTGGTGRQ